MCVCVCVCVCVKERERESGVGSHLYGPSNRYAHTLICRKYIHISTSTNTLRSPKVFVHLCMTIYDLI